MLAVPGDSADDRQFMQKLYQKYKRAMYNMAQSYTADPHDCEDILQDALESLCSKVSRLRELPESALAAYILTTVKNTALNLQKHQGVVDRYVQPLEETETWRMESPIASPEQQLEKKEYRTALEKAWRQLPEQDQDLLYQKYILEKDNEELARWLNCGKDSVRMRLTRIRRKIMALMKEADTSDKT